MKNRLRFSLGLIALLAAPAALAQATYPFRDPKLPLEDRVTDLLSRLTLEEKITMMSGSPKIPRLGLAFTGQVEGLHGLALGGPGHWEGRGKKVVPTTTFPQERGLGNTWDVDLMQKIGALEGCQVPRPKGRSL